MARAAAEDPHRSEQQRRYWRLVARIAERRDRELDGLDAATTYTIGDRWAQRRGSLIR
jgi:hypothetical protein